MPGEPSISTSWSDPTAGSGSISPDRRCSTSWPRSCGSSNRAGPGLYLGAIAINGAALIATVAFLWRRLGPLAALWAAAAIDVFCSVSGVGTLREPWNPYLVVAPMVLFVVLWAAGITGAKGAGVWALVVGSYEVQTHIATAGFVITMAGILLVWPGEVVVASSPLARSDPHPPEPRRSGRRRGARLDLVGSDRRVVARSTQQPPASVGLLHRRRRPRRPSVKRYGSPGMP